MIQLNKKKKKENNNIFLRSFLGNLNIFFIDKIFELDSNLKINLEKDKLIFEKNLNKLSLNFSKNILFFIKKNKLILVINTKKKEKKSILNLYIKLINIKIKGLLQPFKLILILKGIGFKIFIEKNYLLLKIGFSHNIYIKIPYNIKIIIQNNNNIIFSSRDYILLTQFINFVKNHKKPEPYKGKGFSFKNEKILKKEGKKSKK